MKNVIIMLKITLYLMGIIFSIGAISHALTKVHFIYNDGMCILIVGPMIFLATLLFDLYEKFKKKEDR